MTITRTILALLLLTASCTDAGAGASSDPKSHRSDTSIDQTQDAPAMPHVSRSGHDITPLSDEQKSPLVAALTPEQREITQLSGTERPFCGTLLDNKKDGVYACVVCGLPLFTSDHKFISGTGWPSFYNTVDDEHVARHEDRSHGRVRTEIACARCNAHLGHVFPDGPPPTGERHCLNSAALEFLDAEAPMPERSRPITTETAFFAGGCFWGIEHYFQMGPGVINAESGYMQGDDDVTDYRSVCSGATGHAEAVKVVFDPSTISYETLVDAFFLMHDPTQVDRQGPDVGTQYRSGIYTTSPEQEAIARKAIEALNASDRYSRPIATEVEAARTFHTAETYHQDYIDRTGRACHVTNPWPVIDKQKAGASAGSEGD